jgi:hypothetical protein
MGSLLEGRLSVTRLLELARNNKDSTQLLIAAEYLLGQLWRDTRLIICGIGD